MRWINRQTEKIIPEAFKIITLDMIARFLTNSKVYETAYRAGHSCNTVDKTVMHTVELQNNKHINHDNTCE